MKQDLHVHSTFSDGKNTPEELILEAIRLHMDIIGFSDHSYTSFDGTCCMKREKIQAYQAEIRRLSEKYREQISVLLGIEQDYYGDIRPEGYDYIIGSVHYLRKGSDFLFVDWSKDVQKETVEKYYGGDYYAFCEDYFETIAQIPEKTGAGIIGHFDLVSIFNEDHDLYSPEHPRYRAAWQKAADVLLRKGVTFEINTGAISRGYRTEPYPSFEMIQYLKSHGAEFIVNSDSHKKENLCFQYEKWSTLPA